jgi:hypothetical protein
MLILNVYVNIECVKIRIINIRYKIIYLMKFPLDNHTLFYLIIVLFFVQIVIMRYYVSYSIDVNQYKNNKKMVKKIGTHINTKFDKYMNVQPPHNNDNNDNDDNDNYRNRYTGGYEDSVNDPVDDNEDIQYNRPSNNRKYNYDNDNNVDNVDDVDNVEPVDQDE